MNTNLELKEKVLNWLTEKAGLDLLGPFQLEMETIDEEEKTIFKLMLSGTPEEFINKGSQILISPTNNNNNEAKLSLKTIDDGKNLDLYFEAIDQYFIGAYSYLNIDLENDLYEKACILANYANTRSNLAFFQVLNNTNANLKIKVKSFSTVYKGVSDQDLYNVLYAVLQSSYHYWYLFLFLTNSNLSVSDAISMFEDIDTDE